MGMSVWEGFPLLRDHLYCEREGAIMALGEANKRKKPRSVNTIDVAKMFVTFMIHNSPFGEGDKPWTGSSNTGSPNPEGKGKDTHFVTSTRVSDRSLLNQPPSLPLAAYAQRTPQGSPARGVGRGGALISSLFSLDLEWRIASIFSESIILKIRRKPVSLFLSLY
ncbi:hypothetical protein CEXT_163381 [Caerostris extrusa]|uniref:Uncharacterized protein n=1 Tax=Caerostris extrusa TaxID=172846 RepID=A0AAV4W8I5_CAEEX|nr:hypothetical protein CEXT_163381 [Caerostris extrusa]